MKTRTLQLRTLVTPPSGKQYKVVFNQSVW